MQITVIGCGYVGLVTAAGLAEFGHRVIVVDVNRVKIAGLNQGVIPIYEPGLAELVNRYMALNRLVFTDNIADGTVGSRAIFIAVGTPSREDGAADLRQVEAAAAKIAECLTDYTVIINKSTVPVGTGKWLKGLIAQQLEKPVTFDVVSNPEFLREGSAIGDFLQPDRVVLGTESLQAEAVMREIYQELLDRGVPFVFTNLETAELIKYASNAFLATKITFINEIARLCEAVQADAIQVAAGMGLDSRIGPKFLNPGPGYGGSCFPKDTKALVEIGRNSGAPQAIVETVVAANEAHKQYMFQKVRHAVGELQGKTVAVLGLAFKADTDDMRESPVISIVENLLNAGAGVKAHDPEAMAEARKIFHSRIEYCQEIEAAVAGADAVLVATEWSLYRDLELAKLKSWLKTPVLIDLRNIFVPEDAANHGLIYEGVGRG